MENFIYDGFLFINVIRMELAKEDITFDKTKNRVIIKVKGEEFEIQPQIVRELLPVLTEEEKVKDLFMMIHDLNREKLTRMNFFIAKMKELEKGVDDARVELKKCGKMTCIKKWQVIIKSYVDSKNTLAEIRRTITLLEKNKKPLLMRIAKLGQDPYDYL